MKITEVTFPTERAINEAVERGELTLTEGKIMKTHLANEWSEPMTADEMTAFEAKILAEAGIK